MAAWLIIVAIAGVMSSAPRVLHLSPTQIQLTSNNVDSTYQKVETIGGTNPIESCAYCDMWGSSAQGTSVPPSTDPDEMVNPATGDLSESDTLFSDSDPAFNLQFKLTYDSYDAQLATYYSSTSSGYYGFGWRTDGTFSQDYSDSGYPFVVLPTGGEAGFYQSSALPCAGGSINDTAPGSQSGVYFCAEPRVNAEYGEMNNYNSSWIYINGGRQIVLYNYFGQVSIEGDSANMTPTTGLGTIDYGYNKALNYDGCTGPSNTSYCTVVNDQLGRYYDVAFYDNTTTNVVTALQVQDPTGQVWQLQVNSAGDLSKITDPNNDSWGFGYNSLAGSPDANDLNSLTDPDNNTTKIAYTPAGMNGGMVASITDGTGNNTTKYNGWNVIDQTNGDLYTTTVMHPNGQTVAYTYYWLELGEVTTSAADGDTNYTKSYTYSYRLASAPYPPGSVTEAITDPMANTITDVFDGVGSLLTEQTSYGTTTTEYDSWNEPCWSAGPTVSIPSSPTCTTGPSAGSGATFYTYDPYGDQQTVTDPAGDVTTTQYDTGTELPCWVTTSGVSVGTPIPSCSSPPTASIRDNYFSLQGNQLESQYTPDGTTTTPTYDETTYTYNGYGELLTEVSPDGNVTGGTPSNYQTTYYYDNAGRLWKIVAPMGRTTTAGLDAAGNVDTITDPMNIVTSMAYDQDNRLCWSYQGSYASSCSSPPPRVITNGMTTSGPTTFSYDADTSNPLTVTDPDGNTTTSTYLNPNVPNSPTTVEDAMGNFTSTVYDGDGNACVTGTSTTNLYGGSTDPGCTWTSGYTLDTFDELGNVLSSEDGDQNTTGYSRSDLDFPADITKSTPPSAGPEQPTSYTYDPDGRLFTQQEGNGDALTVTYYPSGQKCWQAPEYDPTGVCNSGNGMPDIDGATAYAYNLSGLPSLTITQLNTEQWWAGMTYDAQGQELSEVTNYSGTVGYGYDYAGDNTCVAYPFKSGVTASCSSPLGASNPIVTYGYNADGQMTSMEDWQHNTMMFGYDSRSNLDSISYPTTVPWSETLGPYDAADNLPTETLSSALGSYTSTFGHNADERYSSWTYNSNTSHYTYSSPFNAEETTGAGETTSYWPNGAIETDTPPSGSATNDAYNVDEELTGTTGASPATFAYDQSGNRCASVGSAGASLTCTSGSPSSSFGWNGLGQLCSSSTNSSTAACGVTSSPAPPDGTTSYGYDGAGLRVESTTTSATGSSSSQNYVSDTQTRAGEPLIIMDGNNAYIYGPANFGAGTAPLEQINISTGTVSYLVSDVTGVYALLSSAGIDDTGYTYSTYGVRTTTYFVPLSPTTPFGFDGAYTDSNSNLQYLTNRYYDPNTAQFLSVDPDVAETGQPYEFAGGDPLNASDPLGLYVSGAGTERANPTSTGLIVTTGASPSGVSVAGSYNPGTGAATGAFTTAALPAPTLSTNYDWANLVLQDGGWPATQNNETTMLDWMASEQSDLSIWWTGGSPNRDHINPLNDGACTGGGAGLGTNSNLIKAASCAASNLKTTPGAGYSSIIADFEASAMPSVTAPNIWDSSWASSHYGYGAAWHSGPVASVAAPPDLWGG